MWTKYEMYANTGVWVWEGVRWEGSGDLGWEWEVRDYDTAGQHRYTGSDLCRLQIQNKDKKWIQSKISSQHSSHIGVEAFYPSTSVNLSNTTYNVSKLHVADWLAVSTHNDHKFSILSLLLWGENKMSSPKTHSQPYRDLQQHIKWQPHQYT